jgi:hypothetical protein
MTIGLLFWVIMIIWLLFGLWSNWPSTPGAAGFRGIGGTLIEWILLALLGWKVFGPAIHS